MICYYRSPFIGWPEDMGLLITCIVTFSEVRLLCSSLWRWSPYVQVIWRYQSGRFLRGWWIACAAAPVSLARFCARSSWDFLPLELSFVFLVINLYLCFNSVPLFVNFASVGVYFVCFVTYGASHARMPCRVHSNCHITYRRSRDMIPFTTSKILSRLWLSSCLYRLIITPVYFTIIVVCLHVIIDDLVSYDCTVFVVSVLIGMFSITDFFRKLKLKTQSRNTRLRSCWHHLLFVYLQWVTIEYSYYQWHK